MQARQFLHTIYQRLFAASSKHLHRSEVFCMSPWIQLHAQTNGKVAPCCMSAVHDGNEIGDLRQNPDLESAWNSGNMKQLRRNMLAGKKSSICKHCYEYEKVGKFSERKQYNRDYGHVYDRVVSTQPDGGLDRVDIPLIDIRFSNKCNYKCRICDSGYSSLWYDEEQKIGRINHHSTTKDMRPATDTAQFWESYKKMLPNVRRLHFAGGEPLFMDEHYQALEHLIEIGNTDVVLSYNTNLSTLRYKKYDVINLWNKFKKVDVWASLDGMSEKGDYQRKGQKWDTIEQNIRRIQNECPPVLFGVNTTVSLFNILDIPSFYQYMVDNKFVDAGRLNLYLLFSPAHYNITNLTPALKAKVLQQFADFEKNYLVHIADKKNIQNHIKAVTTYMMSADGQDQAEFRQWISAMDEIREENFVAVYPELSDMMLQAQTNNA